MLRPVRSTSSSGSLRHGKNGKKRQVGDQFETFGEPFSIVHTIQSILSLHPRPDALTLDASQLVADLRFDLRVLVPVRAVGVSAC